MKEFLQQPSVKEILYAIALSLIVAGFFQDLKMGGWFFLGILTAMAL